MAKNFIFTECGTDIHIGEKQAPNVDLMGKSVESAWRNNMDEFSATHLSGVTRVTEEDTGRVVGWVNTLTGKFVKR